MPSKEGKRVVRVNCRSEIILYFVDDWKLVIALFAWSYLKLVYRYFLLTDKDEKIAQQTGTVRTNCVDCLDRTNVTQVHTLKFRSVMLFFMIHAGWLCIISLRMKRNPNFTTHLTSHRPQLTQYSCYSQRNKRHPERNYSGIRNEFLVMINLWFLLKTSAYKILCCVIIVNTFLWNWGFWNQ